MSEPSPHALLTASEMQRVDARAIAGGADGFALMCRAGEAVARHVRRLVSADASVVVVAGSGNNGGDGAVAATALVDAGFGHVVLVRAGGVPPPGSDAARAFDGWDGRGRHGEGGGQVERGGRGESDGRDGSGKPGGPTLVVPADAETLPDAVRDAIGGADLVVDALLGAGLGRDVEGRFADLVRAMDAARESGGATLLAVDLPSGLDGDAHTVRGVAARATLTVTFVRAKIVHRLQPGCGYCGRVVVEDIGMPDAALAAVLDEASAPCHANEPALWRESLPRPAATDHKFRRGHVLVRGGPVHQTGAARLSATAALHAGSGLVTLASAPGSLAVDAAHLTAVMVRPCDGKGGWRSLIGDERIGAFVVGPGNGVDEGTADAVDAVLGTARAVVLDADALTCHGEDTTAFLERLRTSDASVVLTPHEGEFERLFGRAGATASGSRLHRARAAAALVGAVVVLKGPDTVVAAPDGRATINVDAPPWLATAGAGDVLAGTTGALLAQGMSAFEAACAAVRLHADAARELGWPLTAEMLVPAVGRALGAVRRRSRARGRVHRRQPETFRER